MKITGNENRIKAFSLNCDAAKDAFVKYGGGDKNAKMEAGR